MDQHHFIDPLFFLDALLEFATEFDWFAKSGATIDDMGRKVAHYEKQTIVGSLQPQTGSTSFRVEGNTTSLKYRFFCMSLYRINFDDFIHYKGRWLHVDEVQEYDEAGVRECSMTMVNLSDYRDLESYVKYLNGEISV